ncbi:TrkA family potassium uptake protein [Klenkia sp. PcliD-1-E]|uniref:potassium channel family protein n=1 Tax=Klenkia sp. PcliD-1-E TaxID=2954492 RepID=UPI0020976D63|nr:TrkA family potassium uptake protein [Klenkia sp. PcliD-1-E]MCO7221102.1 TrkA family potassium uptake protein [Klenkia sp. PcliD-1-E]
MADHRDPVAVIGLGRFGTALALELVAGGTEVLAVDNRPEVVQRLAGQLDQVVVADSTDLDALTEIGIADVPRVVVAIGSSLEASILTTALLSELGVATIWAKATTRQQATILERVGAHHVVFPERDMGERIAHLVAGRVLDWLEVDPGWVLAKARPPREVVGVPLGETGLRTRYRVSVVSVRAENETSFTHADRDTVLSYGSVVVVAGHPDDVERFVDRP